MNIARKTDRQYWDSTWTRQPRMRLPSSLLVGTRNIQRLLAHHVKPGIRFMEIGCAPGKILAWVAKRKGAEVSGLDYSSRGIGHAKLLFDALGISGDLRCEDIFEASFRDGTFDCVFSSGLIEHFDDPRPLLEIHAKLLKPGGKAVVAIPNYGGIYGWAQHHCDPENLALHNLRIMSLSSLAQLAPTGLVQNVRSYEFGRMTNTLVSLHKVMPRFFVNGLTIGCNAIGLLQPMDIRSLCPLLVLEMTRKSSFS